METPRLDFDDFYRLAFDAACEIENGNLKDRLLGYIVSLKVTRYERETSDEVQSL